MYAYYLKEVSKILLFLNKSVFFYVVNHVVLSLTLLKTNSNEQEY